MKSPYIKLAIIAMLSLAVVGCGKHRVSNKKFYFQLELDGEKTTIKEGKKGYGAGSGSSGSFGTTSSSPRESSSMVVGISIGGGTKPAVIWSLGQQMAGYPTNAERFAMFAPGNYNYYQDQELTTPTALIEWTDENGDFWSTELGSQSGSTFTIIEAEESDDLTTLGSVQIEFACKLYDSSGNMMEVTNGKARGPVGIAD